MGPNLDFPSKGKKKEKRREAPYLVSGPDVKDKPALILALLKEGG